MEKFSESARDTKNTIRDLYRRTKYGREERDSPGAQERKISLKRVSEGMLAFVVEGTPNKAWGFVDLTEPDYVCHIQTAYGEYLRFVFDGCAGDFVQTRKADLRPR